MATGTQAARTTGSPRDFRVRISAGVLLVAVGAATGLFIGGIARQDEPTAGVSQVTMSQVHPLDDYAMRHVPSSGVEDQVTRLGRVDDYALRHTHETP